MNRLGVVVIGRNEGQRLVSCLDSIKVQCNNIVYVDSGSHDNSIVNAEAIGAKTVKLNENIPFTAARARNKGVEVLLASNPELEFIAFVDGDCDVHKNWFKSAVDYLDSNELVAVVCGRRQEKFPGRSIYNLLCDIEWNTAVGFTSECGGDSVMRVSALRKVGWFDPTQIAGEEPELCFRLRSLGWKIYRLDEPMTLHDANIIRFSQWFNRSKRAGFAFAINTAKHGLNREHFCLKETLRVWFWGFLFPLMVICSSIFLNISSSVLFVIYVFQFYRIRSYKLKTTAYSKRDLSFYSFFTQIGKFAELTGQIQFIGKKILSREQRIIEYK